MKLYFHYENIIIYCNFLPIFIIRKFWKFCFPSTPFLPAWGHGGVPGSARSPYALGFGVLAAHLFCGLVVRFRSHSPRKAKNLRLPFSATGGTRLRFPLCKKKKMALRHPLSKNKTPTLQFLLYPSLFSNPCCSMESRVNLKHCNTNRLKEIPFCCATQFNRSNNPSVKRTVRGILAPLNSF